MNHGRVLSDPLHHGPGRILGISAPLIDCSNLVIPNELKYIHENALSTLDNNYIMGPLEQYRVYHSLVNLLKPAILDLFNNSIIVFISSLTVNTHDLDSRLVSEYGIVHEKPEIGTAVGLDITSALSTLGQSLLNSLDDLMLNIDQVYSEGGFTNADLDKTIYFVPIGPVLSIVRYGDGNLFNVFGTDLGFGMEQEFYNILGKDWTPPKEINVVHEVNALMRSKGKTLMGSTEMQGGFEHPFYVYMQHFYDGHLASKALRRDMQPEKFKMECLRHARYNRLITAKMYQEIVALIPDSSEIYPFITKTSPLYKIFIDATKGRSTHDARIMRNVTYPLRKESEKSALAILMGYIKHELLGSRTMIKI